jgi:membrane complex biogenesis BtpA family protein
MAQPIYGQLDETFWARKPLIGMVHLAALPGSPQDAVDADRAQRWEATLQRAVDDARALADGGADAIMVENFFDVPFAKEAVPPHTVAAMTLAVRAVRAAVALPIGVNVLRNDARTALAIAHLCGARFVRINVFIGAAVTDQGIIEGAARAAVLYRKELGADVALWADVCVKHAAQLGEADIATAARDAVHRGLADALIVSGAATGSSTSLEDARRVKAAVPTTPLLIGSGLDAESAATLLAHADGAIVGTSIKRDGRVEAPVELSRVRALRLAMNA